MIFLIQYNREQGRIVRIESFVDVDLKQAEEERLRLELDLGQEGIDDEVVLLEAENEGAVRLTHRRYFEDLNELVSGTPALNSQLLHSR